MKNDADLERELEEWLDESASPMPDRLAESICRRACPPRTSVGSRVADLDAPGCVRFRVGRRRHSSRDRQPNHRPAHADVFRQRPLSSDVYVGRGPQLPRGAKSAEPEP